jgi:hypothetical protein
MTTSIEHRSVQANGITFHVAVSGREDAPPILCLHGFPEGWMSWRRTMEELSEARVYAPDLRGYPGTEYPRDGYDVFTLTDDIKALIEVLGIDKPVLVTHDWGVRWGGSSRTDTRISSESWSSSIARIQGHWCGPCCTWRTFSPSESRGSPSSRSPGSPNSS